MAYFDLADNSTTSIKSKSSGGTRPIDISNFRPKNKKPIGKDWDVNPGDILSWSDYRSGSTYFVTAQRLLRKNIDTSGSGYLTIPLSITRLFPSAMAHYATLLENEPDLVSAIEILPKDGIFADKFGSPLPEAIQNRSDILFVINPMEETIYITINGVDSDGFALAETKTEDIIQYIDAANDPRTAFIVTYEIQGADACQKWPQAPPKGLPAAWTGSQHGSSALGLNHISGTWKYKGPAKTKDTAYNIVQAYYDGFNVNMSWEENPNETDNS